MSWYTEWQWVINRLKRILVGQLGRPKMVDAFVTHMKPMRCPSSVGWTWLVDFSGSACAPRMPMWGSLEMVPGAPEDHPCTCKGHDSDFQPTTWEEHKIGWPLCAPSSHAGLHKGVHCWTASLSSARQSSEQSARGNIRCPSSPHSKLWAARHAVTSYISSFSVAFKGSLQKSLPYFLST